MKTYIIFLLTLVLLGREGQAQYQNNKKLNYKAFCFYYNWYGNPEIDGRYVHWAHEVMKKNPSDTTRGFMAGGDDISSNFYPLLGNYSNNDEAVIKAHMEMIERAGIGVIVLTWWGKDHFTARSVPLIMDEAIKKGISVAFHIEPFGGRNASTTRNAVTYLMDTYGKHPAFYRSKQADNKPFFFIYDSYLIPPNEWATLLQPKGRISVRNTKYDAVYIGLWLNEKAKPFMETSGFDGFYTYFAATGFTAGSTPENWKEMADWAKAKGKIFIPCVGPGYIDTRVRPWNERTTRDRKQGQYYDMMFSKAVESGAPFVGITSFNEWHEGTQIEPAKPYVSPAFHYLDYAPLSPDHYLDQTRRWLEIFQNNATRSQTMVE